MTTRTSTGSATLLTSYGAFTVALRASRHHTMELIRAIGTINFLNAWCASRELRRALCRAEELVVVIPPSRARDDAQDELVGVQSIALPLLALAPTPSPAALRQARSSDPGVSRTQGAREERQWVAARRGDSDPPRNALVTPGQRAPTTARTSPSHSTNTDSRSRNHDRS
jgi:hypothetical protein